MKAPRAALALALLLVAVPTLALLTGEAEAWEITNCFPDWPECCPEGQPTYHAGHGFCVPVPERP